MTADEGQGQKLERVLTFCVSSEVLQQTHTRIKLFIDMQPRIKYYNDMHA